jgi:hypothetical protein
LLNAINENPNDYTVIIENWNEEKAKYIAALEDLFKKYIVERDKVYNGFSYILYAMNRWYMALPKYAKELKEEYCGQGVKAKTLEKSHVKYINSLRILDENPRDYLFERLVSIFEFKKLTLDLVAAIKSAMLERDAAVDNLISRLANDVKILFAGRKTMASLSSIIRDWYEKLGEHTLQRLFANNENQILSLFSTIDNNDTVFIQRLAKAVSGLRIEDWTNQTIVDFLKELSVFKETIDEFNDKKQTAKNTNAAYKIIFTGTNGAETIRVFDKTKYGENAELMFEEMLRVVAEYNQSVSESEKRQVIVEILEKFCQARN